MTRGSGCGAGVSGRGSRWCFAERRACRFHACGRLCTVASFVEPLLSVLGGLTDGLADGLVVVFDMAVPHARVARPLSLARHERVVVADGGAHRSAPFASA